MFCPKCGKEIPADAKFCDSCGTLVELPPENVEPEKPIIQIIEPTPVQDPGSPQGEDLQKDIDAVFEQPENAAKRSEPAAGRPGPAVPVTSDLEPIPPKPGEGNQPPKPDLKNILNKKIILLAAGVLAVVLLAVVLISVLSSAGGGSGSNSIVYLTDDDELMFRKDLKVKTEAAEITDDDISNLVFSDDGKYIYYVENQSLYIMELAQLGKKGASPEKISSDVSSYNFKVLSNGNVLYIKGTSGDGQLRLYNGKDSFKLTGDLSYMPYVTEAEAYAYYSEYDSGTSTLYRIQLKENGERERLVKEYDNLYYRDDSVVVYGKETSTFSYCYDVYSQVIGGDKSKLASDVYQMLDVSASKGKVNMTYLTYEDYEDYDLRKYENGNETVLVKEIESMEAYSAEAGVYLYTKDGDWYQFVGGQESKFKLDDDARIYGLYVLNGKEAVLHCYVDGGYELKAYTIGKTELTPSEDITDEEYTIGGVGSYKGKDVLYYFTDLSRNGDEGELIRYANGEKTSVVKDAAGVLILKDGSATFKSDADSDDTLYLVKSGKSERIADDVESIAILSGKLVAYVSDGDLYVWNGSKSEKLANDVQGVMAVKEAEYEIYECY